MNTRQKLTLGIAAVFMVTLTIVGVTYAYFVTRVTGAVTESINVSTANLGSVIYEDGNGVVSLLNVEPGVTTYKTFSVANLGTSEQSFSLFAKTTVPEGEFTTTQSVNDTDENGNVTGIKDEAVTYEYGEFIHSVNGDNADDGVIANCYSATAKRSSELADEETSVCYASNGKYNNIKITLYKLDDNNINTVDTANNTYTLVEGQTSNLANFTSDSLSDTQIVSGIPSQLNYSVDTSLKSSITIGPKTVQNYVMKVEYLDTAVTTPEDLTDDNQNAENLAALNIKVDINS